MLPFLRFFMSNEVKITNYFDHAINEIEKTYGDVVSIKEKGKSLSKFGSRQDVDQTSVFVWEVEGEDFETYLTDNLIDTVSSDDASNTQDIVIEGQTVDADGDFTFVVQTATLDGQNKVVLSTPLARVTRSYNNGSIELASSSSYYIYEDTAISGGVPTDTSTIHMQVLENSEQSRKAATTISKDDYYLIRSWTCGVRRNTGTPEVDFSLEVRLKGKIFRTQKILSVGNTTIKVEFEPFFIIPPNSDIQVLAVSGLTNTSVSSSFDGVLAIIESNA